MALTRALRSCQGFKPNSSATRCRNRYKRRLTSSGRATRTKEHSRVRLLRTFSTVRANSADNSNCARGFGSAVVTAIREAAPLARFFTCYLSMRGPPPPEVTESAGSALITFHPRPQRPVSPQASQSPHSERQDAPERVGRGCPALRPIARRYRQGRGPTKNAPVLRD
jgi:hypothetical protein